MSEIKVFKKGEFLFKEGDKISHLFLIQSGGVTQCLQKEKKIIDLAQIGSSQILGEGGLFGGLTHTTGAMATSETKVVMLPIDGIKSQMEALPQAFKYVVKSLSERLKVFTQEIKGSRLEKNGVPCPEENIPRLFASLYFACIHKGEKDKQSEAREVEWPNFKTYLHKVFSEQPKRAENAVFILKKLGLAELEYGKPPEDPEGLDVLLSVTFLKPSVLEAFFEFYQYFYFKSGKGDILKYDEFFAQIVEILIEEAQGKPIDKYGSVRIDFQSTADKIKQKLNIQFGNDHFSRLEAKGVLVKRATFEEKPCVEFAYHDLQNILFGWRMIHEIDKWNKKGYVDLDEKPAENQATGNACPQCQSSVDPSFKFCASCGFKVEGLFKSAA